MTAILKLRVDSVNSTHVRMTLLMGDEKSHESHSLANVGQLCMSIGEYQIFGAALLLGAGRTQKHLKVICEDKKFIEWRDRRIHAGINPLA